MSKIATTFEILKKSGKKALMPYLTMGFPRLGSAFELVPALVEGGADLIELGVPFSDPLADGATIQASGQKALDNGMTLALCLEQAGALRARGIKVPFVLMGYYNPILQMGIDAFAQRAARAGVDGAIVPDLPPEESDALREALHALGIDLIFLLSPASSEGRIKWVTQRTSGFQYLVSLLGVTGVRDRLSADLGAFVARVRGQTDLPLAVGFGIGTPAQAALVAQIADGVIVGSALIKTIGTAASPAPAARNFIARLRAGMDAA
ncbi:MAG: tryptophan synthase subunit alpha [Anaerolineae bacterium]|nr:tryptophan synthase subunit alpha [Anaerolineae bacterium]